MPRSTLAHPSRATVPGDRRAPASELPAWPLLGMFGLFPLWWFLGLADLIWILTAAPMVLLMIRSRAVRVPRGFGLYLLFCVWVAFSASQLESVGQALGFSYRFLLYLSAGVLFVYVYNARHRLTERAVTGALVGYWLATVAGGYLALAAPGAVLRTPLSHLLPASLIQNDLVNHMVIRRMTQWNPDAWVVLDPRPSAPFLYTNNWGNVYSLVIPIVIAYLFHVRGTKRFWFIAAMLPISAVPAVLTLNRGMFIGLALAVAYVTGRLLLMRNVRAILAVGAVAVIAGGAFFLLPAQERLESRVSESSTTADRASLYVQALQTFPESPLFGHAVPQSSDQNRDPVGTQGQFWMVLVSHGLGSVVCFVGWFLVAFFRSWRRQEPTGLAANTVLVVGVVELFYYGSLPYGLPILMTAAALALRPTIPTTPVPNTGEVATEAAPTTPRIR